MNESTNKVAYTISDLYDLLPLGKNSIYKLVNEKDFPKLKIGKKYIIPIKGFEDWLKSHC